MNIKNIYTGWKSTIIGVLLFLGGLGYVFFNTTPDYVIMSILLASGVLLLFAPDFLINKLEDFVGKKSNEV